MSQNKTPFPNSLVDAWKDHRSALVFTLPGQKPTWSNLRQTASQFCQAWLADKEIDVATLPNPAPHPLTPNEIGVYAILQHEYSRRMTDEAIARAKDNANLAP